MELPKPRACSIQYRVVSITGTEAAEYHVAGDTYSHNATMSRPFGYTPSSPRQPRAVDACLWDDLETEPFTDFVVETRPFDQAMPWTQSFTKNEKSCSDSGTEVQELTYALVFVGGTFFDGRVALQWPFPGLIPPLGACSPTWAEDDWSNGDLQGLLPQNLPQKTYPLSFFRRETFSVPLTKTYTITKPGGTSTYSWNVTFKVKQVATRSDFR